MTPLTPADVQAALDRLIPGTQMTFFETTTATSQQAADNIGCALGQIVKSLCFIVETEAGDQPVLILTSGDQRVDDRKIAARYGVGRKRVRVARGDELVSIYGYEAGSVPPIGHRSANIPTYIDETLARFEQLYAAGGAHNAIFPITLADLQQATGGIQMDVVRESGAEPS